VWKADALEAGTLAASDAASFERHVRACKECRDRLRIDMRLRSVVEQLSALAPEDLRIHRLRARILSDARERATHPPSRWTRAWTIGAVTLLTALLAVTFLVSHHRSLPLPDDPLAGSVTGAPGVQWSQSREAKVETLRLTQGELWIVVRKQTPDERFLVKMPDGEIEVRGTTFNVRVDDHVTRHVHVVEGRVALRLRGRPALELAAGQSWDLDTPAPSATPSLVAPLSTLVPTSVAAAPLPDVRNPPPPTWRPNMESEDYKAAMDLYRGAQYAEAAEAFRRFATEHRSSGLMEDATFLEALSLTRSGRIDAGSVVASRHLAEFPNSFHRKEASFLVARAARDRGDCREARRSLAPWLGSDADATISEALGACAEP
jgi:hypothetical protein